METLVVDGTTKQFYGNFSHGTRDGDGVEVGTFKRRAFCARLVKCSCQSKTCFRFNKRKFLKGGGKGQIWKGTWRLLILMETRIAERFRLDCVVGPEQWLVVTTCSHHDWY